ncbi:MAG: PAS domain-containing protein [Holophagales bacterium]|nr:PAS domain-containing protein [Holophagales bacterium]
MTETEVLVGEWRLSAMGLSPRTARALAGRIAASSGRPPFVVDVSAWSESELEECRCGPGDVIVVGTGGDARRAERVRAFRARHPGVPALARVPRHRSAEALEMLRSGFQEVFSDVTSFPAALERARARMAALPGARIETVAGPASESPEPPFDTVVPNVFDWIYVVGIGEDGRMGFETVNPPLHAGAGFLSSELAGRSVEEGLAGPSAGQLVAHFARVLGEGLPLQFEEEHVVAGKVRAFQTSLTPVRNKWGRIHRIAGISRDITALKEALSALRASEERLNHALEGTQQGLWDWDLATGRVYRSPRWFGMIGLPPGGIDDSFDAGLKLIHPDDRRQLESAMSAHLEGRVPRLEAEYRLRARNGEWIWIFDAGKVVAWDPGGRPSRVAGMCTDITERRRAEEALRALVGGVVHEIRNPVYGIFINLDALEATFGEEPRYGSFVTALRESAERIASLVNDLRDYGEPRTLSPEPHLVRDLVENTVRSCEKLASDRSCRVTVEFEDPSLLLPLNGRRMHQVFRNLLENALLHSPPGGIVRVDVRKVLADGFDWWTFTVADAGTGFDAETLTRAFEPFFTRRKGGTGLGLSIVKRVVEEHGGSVEAANRPEGGARVTVRLPAPRSRAGALEAGRG